MLGWFKMVTSWSILLGAVIYQISLSTAQQTGKLGDIEFGCPSDSIFHHGYCFRKVDVRLVWEDAVKACERTGMYLAWIDDNIENEYIAKTIMSGVNKYWIGLSNTTTSTSRNSDDFVWRQFRSEEWKVVGCENGLWKNLQPDGSMGECVATYKDSVDNHWTFSNCMEKLPFVCKLQAAPMPNDVFFCENGKYINKKWKCDTQNDCGDNSDEVDCGNSCSYLINAKSAQTGTIRASSLSGSIQSSVGANAVYQDKTTCKWILKAPIGERFKLAISGLALEENADVLRIWTGGISKKESELIGQVTGTQSGTQNFYSSNNLVILELHTDASVRGSGFTVTWTAGVSSTIWNGMKTYTATSTWQKLSSPEYPVHVPFGLNMEWLINSTSVITLEFLTVHLPSTSSLLIYDGEELTSPLVYRPSLGSVPTPAIYISKHALVRIVLITKTHGYSEYKGFQLQFKQGCSLTLDSALNGMIQSPGYLIGSYPDDVTCEWILKRPSAQSRAISLRFHEFKLKNQSDFVEIYNDTSNTVLTKDLSGQGPVTDVFRSTDGHLRVVFKSNLVLLDKGFSAEYSLDCPVLAVSEWTEISVPGLYTAFNTEVVLSCKSGYSFKQQEYHMMSSVPLLCKPGGMWNVSRIPDCQVSYCGVPPAIDNGILKSASGVTVGHNATYECNGGFTMTVSTDSGSDTIICKADGEWQSRPTCNAQQCTGQSKPVNGDFNITIGSGTDYATVIRFLCDPGYELVGSVYVYCQSNGSWSHGLPQCIKTGCPIPSVQNGKITGTTPIKFQDSATLSCDTGYYINGSSLSTTTEQLTCGANGQFTPMKICVDKDECSQSACPANTKCENTEGSYICSCLPGYHNPSSTPNGACTDINECDDDNGGCKCLASSGDPFCLASCADSDGSYTCSCSAGYELYAYPEFNNISLAGNENGLRPGDHIRINHTCVRTLCPTPTPPQNGQMLSKRKLFYYGDTVQFECNHGYEPSRPREVVNQCLATGRWQYDVINCTIGTCTTPALTSDMNYVRIHPNPSTVVNFGDAVIIECRYGSIIKNQSLYCGTTGSNSYELLGDSINCSVIDCGPPEEVPGASYLGLMSNTLGSNFTFSCNNGSSKSGQSSTSNDDIVICQENRQWSFGNLTCTGGRCTDPGTPGGAEQVVKSYEVGQELGFKCTRPGFAPVPSTPLLCQVVPNTNNVEWNSTTLPMCEDVTAPVFENCPGIIYVDKTEAVNYTIPTATDNTGTLKNFSVDPANFKPMTVVSENMNVTYTAEDHSGNQQTCTIVIMIKDRNPPVLGCPTLSPISTTISTAAGVKVNISERVTVDPDSSNRMYYPNQYISVNSGTIDTRQKVTVTASDRWGAQSSCSFLVVTNVDTCFRESFPANVPNATVSCTEGNITCTVTCNNGYVYEDGNRTKQYSCSGSNNWMPSNVPEACLGYGSPSYKAKFTVTYTSSVPSSSCQSGFEQSINIYKATIAQKLTDTCKSIQIDPGTFVINSFKTSVLAFTITAEYTGEFTGVGTDGSRDFCLNYFATVPTRPQDLLHVTTLNCGSAGISDLSIPSSSFTVISKGNSCDDDKTLTNTVVGQQCVTCPPGTYVENRQCKTCPDGRYQDMSGQTTCKMCPANHVPHTDKTRCTALCPMGFTSSNGMTICVPCPKDEYWVNATTCVSCPAGHSTVNVTAVQNESGCKAPCPLGTFSVSGYMPCQDCPLHHYQNSPGQQQCKECAQNQITSATASNSSSYCIPYPSGCNSTTRCSGNGECRIFNHATYCICNTGYKGDSCQDDVNPCDSSPCLNGGVCSKVDSSDYNCTCKADKSCTLKQLSGNIVVPTGQHEPPFQRSLAECKTACDTNSACNAVYHTNGYCFLVFRESYTKQSYSQTSQFFEKDCQTTTLFNGTRCEIDLVNSCGSDSCGDHGMCQDLVGSNRCLCPIVGEYTGPTCVLDVNLCSPNPCQNGAKCESYGSVRRQCICQPGYTGLNCSVNINDCTMNPNGCSYNGTCKDGVDKYTCDCLPGFSGDHCKNTKDFCQSDGCPNGYCFNDYSTLSSKCYCEHPYELGSNGKCSKVDLCNTTKCFSNGTDKCEDGVCKCVSGYEGSLCQHSVDNCQNNPCKNGGTCTDGHNAFSCKCVTGYDGNTCENNINDCPGNCSTTNTKQCHDLVDGYRCECYPGWMGGNCTEEIDECASFPCEHGATCTDKMNGYHCNCSEGWTGTNCQNQINYCQTSGCNSGECINLIDGRFCRCSAGTRGDRCDVVPNVCNIVNPCTTLGQCQNKNGTAECSCTNQIYAGDSCELIKDFCGSGSPCGSGGSCSNLPAGNYKCTCNTGYSGTSCETKASRCASLSCHSSAKCLDSEIGCYCPSGKVLTNTGCKGSDSDIEFDLLFDPMIGDEGASSFAVFQQQTPSALSFMFWVKFTNHENANTAVVLEFSFEAPDERSTFLSVGNTSIAFTNESNTENVNFQHQIDDGRWHHVVVTWKSSGMTTVYVDAIRIASEKMTVTIKFPKTFNIMIGKKFGGRISQVRLWESSLTNSDMQQLQANYKFNPTGAVLLHGWYQYQLKKGASKVYPTQIRNNDICDVPSCSAKDKIKPKVSSCGPDLMEYTDQRVFQNFPAFPAMFDGYTTLYNSTKPDDVYTWGDYNEAVVASDSEGNTASCQVKYYVKFKPDCEEPKTAAQITYCPGTRDICGVGCIANQKLSMPTPQKIKCSPLGVYNTLNPRRMFVLPSCGGFTQKTIKVVATMQYDFGVNDCISPTYEDAIRNKIVQTFANTVRLTWTTVCTWSSPSCTNVEVTAKCNAKKIDITLSVSELSNVITRSGSNEVYKAKEVFRVLLFQEKVFTADDIAGATLLTSTVMIQEEESCQSGYVIVGDNCVQCGMGSYLNTTMDTCYYCPIGTYAAASGTTQCTSCGAGKTTRSVGSTSSSDCVVTCQPGQYLDNNTNACQSCPKHYYQELTGQDHCLPCPLGKKTSTTGSNSSTLCFDDCPAGTALKSSGQCVECDRGYYRTLNDDICMPCPPEFTTVGNGSKIRDDCKIRKCYAGNFRNASNLCEPCPMGQYQPENLQDMCMHCPQNFTTVGTGNGNITDCKFYCKAGFDIMSEMNRTCKPCARGTYKDNSDPFATCASCPSGNTTENMQSTSEQQCSINSCDAGQEVNDQGSCTDCPMNKYQPVDQPNSSNRCLSCPTMTATKQIKTANLTDCLTYCNPGFEFVSQMNRTCIPCARGTYKDNSDVFANCSACPAGNTTENMQSTSEQQCSINVCEAGQEVNRRGTCSDCPFDKYQPMSMPASKDQCLACPTGKGTKQIKTANLTDCLNVCAMGKQYNATAKSCEHCPKGFWNNGNLTMKFEMCEACPVNYTTSGPGMVSVDNCTLLDCAPGYYISGSNCLPCDYGYYQPNRHQTSCIACKVNLNTSSVASATEDSCQIYCGAGLEGQTTCAKCQPGFYKSTAGIRQCEECTGNYTSNDARTECDTIFCDKGFKSISTNGNISCDSCPIGKYKDARGNTDCTQCPVGFLTANTASTDQTDCSQPNCVPGKFLNASGVCELCHIGTYKSTTGNGNCTACYSNLTTTSTGSTAMSDCSIIVCEAGEKRVASSNTCMKCSVGTYQPERGQQQCIQCASGNTTGQIGSTMASDCVPFCGQGREYNSTSRSCFPCPLGSYKSTEGNTDNCQTCPTGKTTGSTGSTSSTDCNIDDCLPGTYRDAGGCKNCTKGTYQSLNSQTSCNPCPSGETTISEAAVSDDYCIKDCSAGQQYDYNDNSCKPCPVNYYTNRSVSEFCLLCPTGYITLGAGSSGGCIKAPDTGTTTPAPVLDITYKFRLTFRGQIDCTASISVIQNLVKDKIRQRLLQLLIQFPNLCRLTNKANCFVSISVTVTNNGCTAVGRRKRAVADSMINLEANVPDLNEVATNSQNQASIQSSTLIQQDLNTNRQQYQPDQLTLESSRFLGSTLVCPSGSVKQGTTCVPCPAGTYQSQTCMNCSVDTYQDQTGQTSCKTCPGSVKIYTLSEGSHTTSDCVSICAKDSTYCRNGGACMSNTLNVWCSCPERYTGARCTEKAELTSNTAYIIGGSVGGVVAVMFIILIIVGVVRCLKRSGTSSKKSYMGSSKDAFEIDYNRPFPVYDNGYHQSKRGGTMEYSRMNPAFVYDDRMEGDTYGRERYPFSDDSSAYRWQEA